MSLAYEFAMTVRNKLYDSGILKTHTVSVPVISVGNITTGGTGKTPMISFIAKHFLKQGMKVAVIARGYKRESKDIQTLSASNKKEPNTELFGDELTMLFEEMRNNHGNRFYIAAAANRVKAAEILIEMYKPDIILLDDAFQHRKIKRDIDLVMIDASDFSHNSSSTKYTIPSGKLRESISGLHRAGLMIQNNKTEKYDCIASIGMNKKSSCIIGYKTEYIMDFKNDILQNRDSKKAIVFSGIAEPASLTALINAEGITIEKNVRFADHHVYTDRDIEQLTKTFSGDNIFITTEKDFVKIREFKDFIKKYPVYYLKLRIEFEINEDIFFNMLNKFLG